MKKNLLSWLPPLLRTGSNSTAHIALLNETVRDSLIKVTNCLTWLVLSV